MSRMCNSYSRLVPICDDQWYPRRRDGTLRRSGVDKNGKQPMTKVFAQGRVVAVVPLAGPNMHDTGKES